MAAKLMSIYEKQVYLFRPMHADDQGLFDIGSAAWSRRKADHRGKLLRITLFQSDEPVANVVHQLVRIGYADMDGGVDARRPAAMAGIAAEDDAACPGHEAFAGGDGSITIAQGDIREPGEGMLFERCPQLFFEAIQLFKSLARDQRIQMGDQLAMIHAKDEFALQLCKLLGKFDLEVLTRRKENGSVAFTLRKRNRR